MKLGTLAIICFVTVGLIWTASNLYKVLAKSNERTELSVNCRDDQGVVVSVEAISDLRKWKFVISKESAGVVLAVLYDSHPVYGVLASPSNAVLVVHSTNGTQQVIGPIMLTGR